MGQQIKTEKANKGREGKKDREGKKTEKAKTEKTGKDREGKKTEKAKKTDWYIQRRTYLATAGGQLPYRESARNTAGRHSELLWYLSVFSLVKRYLCSMARIPC